MNYGFNLKQQIASASMVVALVSAGCALTPNRPNVAAPGSSYVTEVRNSGSYGTQNTQNSTKVAGAQMWQGRKVFVYEGSTGMRVITDAESGRWIAFARGDVPVTSWDPPFGWDFPLYVGRTGTGKYHITNHVTKKNFDFEGTWRVDAYEDVTVPAGTFKSYKVVYSDDVGTDSTTWWSPDLGIFVKSSGRRSAKHPLGAGTTDSQLVSHAITVARQ